MKQSVHIVIAEPSDIIRTGLACLLQKFNKAYQPIREVSDYEQLKTTISLRQPEVLIINPAICDLISLSLLRKTLSTDVKIVALQTALAVCSTWNYYDDVISLYDSTEQIQQKLARLTRFPDEEKKTTETLTTREKEIIAYVVKGLTNNEIAEKLFLSSHTVISHRRNIAAKLQIHSTAGLTIYAIVNKLVNLDESEFKIAKNAPLPDISIE
ncbi:MAG: LuxR C-terminal-related transcriptional regulator [Candidatus Symbiothrix sp.]|jgi:DNA-binding NarL/FixJ family response regulator|nr:LuxR C-terminal-related transcriptional regulator [Candidatus Symbiothrix sp.]